LNCLGDLAHDTGAAAEVQDLANLEVCAFRVDSGVSSEDRLDGDTVGLSDLGAEVAGGNSVGAAARNRCSPGRVRGCSRSRRRYRRRHRRRHTRASGAVADRSTGRRVIVGGAALDIRAGVGELDIDARLRRAVVADIGDEHVREVVESRAAAAFDGNVCAVHVHLPVTGLVEPCPCPERITSLGIGRDGKAVDLVRVEFVFTDRADAVADERFDDFPSLAVVERERDLARATVVCGLVALRAEGCLLTCNKDL